MNEVNYGTAAVFKRVLSVSRSRKLVIIDSSFQAFRRQNKMLALSRFLKQNVLEFRLKPDHRAVQNVDLCVLRFRLQNLTMKNISKETHRFRGLSHPSDTSMRLTVNQLEMTKPCSYVQIIICFVMILFSVLVTSSHVRV